MISQIMVTITFMSVLRRYSRRHAHINAYFHTRAACHPFFRCEANVQTIDSHVIVGADFKFHNCNSHSLINETLFVYIGLYMYNVQYMHMYIVHVNVHVDLHIFQRTTSCRHADTRFLCNLSAGFKKIMLTITGTFYQLLRR